MNASLPELPTTPLVSVLTLAYNHEQFIAEAIESVLAQDWPADRVEHLVLNDGSTDATSRVLDAYRTRVTVVEQENVGMRASVDRAMHLLTGDLITILDGDDVMLPGRIERQARALRDHPDAGLVYTDGEMIDRTGNLLERSFIDWAGLARVNGRVRGPLLTRNFASGGACMFHSSLKTLISPLPEDAPWPDYWWAWAINGVADVVHVPEATYRYRAHGANQTLGAHHSHRANVTKEIPFRLRMLSEVEPDEASAAELLAGIVAMLRLLPDARPEAPFLQPGAAARKAALGWHADAYAALEADDLHAAALACARAAASNPVDPALIAIVRSTAARLDGERSPRPRSRDVFDSLGARRSVVLADASALLAAPQLLDAFAAGFEADADVTLVIHAAAGSEEHVDALTGLVAQRGLDGADAPDMVLASEPAERLRSLAAGADAILGPDTFGSDVPAFGVGDVESLTLFLRHRGADDPAMA